LGRVQDIRNHVLHGAATYRFSKNRESVSAALAILGALVPAFVQVLESPWAESSLEWPHSVRPGKWTPQNLDSQVTGSRNLRSAGEQNRIFIESPA
jgi:hypothetical protein